jgi:SAM-dependent methyltransferase
MNRYQEAADKLRLAYDRSAEERDKREISPWKHAERQAFLRKLQDEGKNTFLELGAGPGRDSLYFQQNGLQVVSTDLSPEMVRLCRDKGLEAHEMDFLNLDFPANHFSAVYALNSLLHVPKPFQQTALLEIRRVMEAGGLYFLGIYGGIEQDAIWEADAYEPKRHFTFHTDRQIRDLAQSVFEICDFKTIEIAESEEKGLHFQRLILRKSRSVITQPT